MSLPLLEHDASGRARYAIRNADDIELARFVERAHRPIPVVDSAMKSIQAGPWFAGRVACLACCTGWIAVAPVADVEKAGRGLECLGCGGSTSAPVQPAWCSSCGKEQMVAQHEGAPFEGGECVECHAMAVFVEAA